MAVAPGVYAAYAAVVSDLASYIDGPLDGDRAVIAKLFPSAGGSCWSGVKPGSQAP